MAIGILSALDGIQGEARPDDNSVVPPIDRLASLPQALIMQMAQKGQIPKTMVAPVLAKKAENAQLGMQMQAAMQKAQAGAVPPSTVIEKVIAQNAAQEAAPMNRSNVGVASAPMRPDMYRRGMAGGGIVAFAPGGLYDQERFSPPASFSRSLAQQEGGIDRLNALKIKEKYEANMPIDAAQGYAEYRDALRKLGIEPEPRKTYSPEQTIDGPIQLEGSGMGEYRFEDEGQAALDAYRKSLSEPRSEFTPIDTENLSEDQLNALSIETFGKPLGEVQDVKTDKVEEVVAPPTIEKDDGLDNISAAEGKIQTEAIVKELKEDQKGNKNKPAEPKEFVGLSGDDVAMLGLQFGLELLGTDQQNFFTAIGKAGKPALKTALAIKQEKKKQAFTKSEREAGQKFQLELEDKKIAGQKEVQELVINAPEKIQKIAMNYAIMRSAKDGSKPVITQDDLKRAARVLGTNSSTEAAIISVVAKGVEGGIDAFNNAVRAGGVLRDFQAIAVGREAKLSPGEEENLANAKAQLAQQRDVSPDSISDQDAAQFILNRVQKEYINKSMSNVGVAPPKFKGIVDEYFGSGKILDFSQLPKK